MPLLQGGVHRAEGLDSMAFLFRPSLLIRSEACADLSDKLPDGPLGPLRARSYSGINGRPSLVINPIPTQPITKGGIGDLGIEL